ncbi:MAG: ribonuclease H family protein [Dysgonamonadaceae bacterium]|jgi:ribonuclease HI|nr:ribonuclease H family protein [Dysgonamonadaceae bacterium]
MTKKKWYVVWRGNQPGVYATWQECKNQTEGFENALYKAFESAEEAAEAYPSDPWRYIGQNKAARQPAVRTLASGIIRPSLSVDAACSGNPGRMEYRGVYTGTGEEVFHQGPFQQGTNNVGEFLALVHGLALLKQQHSPLPVYSDSVNAILWVRNRKCKTRLQACAANEVLFDLIRRAENWLINNTYTTPILKWETNKWGEIPADFGRK